MAKAIPLTRHRLTVEDLERMEPRTIFATGVCEDKPLGVNMSNSGRELRWIAVRNVNADWAVYWRWEDSARANEWTGSKMPKYYAAWLVPCTDEALERYRK